jgi:hypothetical protein
MNTLSVTFTDGSNMELEGELEARSLGKLTKISALEEMVSGCSSNGSHVEAVSDSPSLRHDGCLMDDQWIIRVLLESTRSTSLLLSLTDDIGPSSIVGDIIWKGPSDLEGVSDLIDLSGTRDDWVSVESRRDTAVRLSVSSKMGSWETEWSGVDTSTLGDLGSVIWISTERHETSGLVVVLARWLGDGQDLNSR